MDPKSAAVMYKVFYLVLNLVFTIYESVENTFLLVRNKLLELCHEFLPVNKHRTFPKLAKTPTHLTVLLGSEEPSFQDLANLILWCLAARITFVSFYDYKGALAKSEDKLRSIVETKKNSTDHVIWHNRLDSGYKNGYAGRKVHVKVLTHGEGRGGVVELTKSLTSSSNITVESFDQKLKKDFQFPDPDLGVCCGKTFSLYGYPPWQIRVTEFLTIRSHHNIEFDTFVMLLSRYNKCEQRYGK